MLVKVRDGYNIGVECFKVLQGKQFKPGRGHLYCWCCDNVDIDCEKESAVSEERK